MNWKKISVFLCVVCFLATSAYAQNYGKKGRKERPKYYFVTGEITEISPGMLRVSESWMGKENIETIQTTMTVKIIKGKENPKIADLKVGDFVKVRCQKGEQLKADTIYVNNKKIAKIQNAAIKAGLFKGFADGYAGKQWVEFVKKFQKEKGIKDTGELDDATMKALEAASIDQ